MRPNKTQGKNAKGQKRGEQPANQEGTQSLSTIQIEELKADLEQKKQQIESLKTENSKKDQKIDELEQRLLIQHTGSVPSNESDLDDVAVPEVPESAVPLDAAKSESAAQTTSDERLSCLEQTRGEEEELLDKLCRVQDEARTLAVDATSNLQGTISEVLRGAKVLEEFRDKLFRWENDLYKYSLNDLASFVRQYWFLVEHVRELINALSQTDASRLQEMTEKLLREVEADRGLLTRACASLGLKLILPCPGDPFDEDSCDLLEGSIPADASSLRVREMASPGLVRLVEEGEEQLILPAFVRVY